MNSVKASLKLSEQARKKQAHASTTDSVRRHCDLGEAAALARQSSAALPSLRPLKTGAGGEIIPPASLGTTGLKTGSNSLICSMSM